MQHFKKALLVTSAFILVIALLTFPFVWSTWHNNDYTDREERKSLAGKLDYLIVGASQGLRSLKPSIIDEALGFNSYNLSGILTTFNGREALLYEELARNDIKTVVIEISRDTMGRTTKALEGDMFTLPRLSSFDRSLDFLIKNVDVSQWDYVYYHYFNIGVRNLLQEIRNTRIDTIRDNGYIAEPQNDITIDASEIESSHNSISLDITTNSENYAALERMIKAIHAENAQVYIAVIPLSDRCIWEVENWDQFETSIENLGAQLGVKIIDFNLLKSRYEILKDESSFYDVSHMSDEGATAFSQEYSKIMSLLDSGESIDHLFYESYAEMKADSPYITP